MNAAEQVKLANDLARVDFFYVMSAPLEEQERFKRIYLDRWRLAQGWCNNNLKEAIVGLFGDRLGEVQNILDDMMVNGVKKYFFD